MKRIKRFGVWQTAKVVSVMYFLLIAVFVIPFGIIATLVGGMFDQHFPFGGLFMIFMPFLYGVIIFIMTALGCLVYNLIAQWTGGIEIEVELAEEE